MQSPHAVAYVLRARSRLKVMDSLQDGRKVSAQIENETGMYKSHVSRALKELQDSGFVRCANPEDRMYKFYELTGKGKSTLKDAKAVSGSIKSHWTTGRKAYPQDQSSIADDTHTRPIAPRTAQRKTARKRTRKSERD